MVLLHVYCIFLKNLSQCLIAKKLIVPDWMAERENIDYSLLIYLSCRWREAVCVMMIYSEPGISPDNLNILGHRLAKLFRQVRPGQCCTT